MTEYHFHEKQILVDMLFLAEKDDDWKWSISLDICPNTVWDYALKDKLVLVRKKENPYNSWIDIELSEQGLKKVKTWAIESQTLNFDRSLDLYTKYLSRLKRISPELIYD